MKYSLEQFKKKVEEKYREPFEILEYNGTSKPGLLKCGYCQEERRLYRMGELLKEEREHICSHCFSSTYATQVLQVLERRPDLAFIKFGYKSNLHKPTVVYSCDNCGETTEKPYVEFLKYPTCIHCGFNAKRKTGEGFKKELPSEFELIGEYKGSHEKTLMRHSCGFIFKIAPGDVISGHSYCPKCSKKASKGERRVMDYLTEHNIAFVKEKVFEWSDRKRYDFYLPDYNLLIEYHGRQHYEWVPTFQLTLEEQQRVDQWKEKEAKKRGFEFFTISYLDFNKIENLLAQRLKENT